MLLFGSELKSLLVASGGCSARSIRCAVEEYFALGYVAEPRTIFKACTKLPPGPHADLRRGQPLPAPRRVLGRALHASTARSTEAEAQRGADRAGCANRCGCA